MRVGIIGAGTAAAIVLENLAHVRHTDGSVEKLDVMVFDASTDRWCGRAFAPDVDQALSQSTMAKMSLRAWEPNAGIRWLQANGFDEFVDPNTFAPRAVIGRYFKEAIEEAVTHFDSFELVPEFVKNIKVSDAHVTLTTDKRQEKLDHVFMCVGGAATYDPYQLAGRPGYCDRPYPLFTSLGDVGSQERIGIIGSGLTAVDIVAGLKAKGHQGSITFLSRHGILPAIRRPTIDYVPAHYTLSRIEQLAKKHGGRLRLADVIALFRKELAHAGTRTDAIEKEFTSKLWGFKRLKWQLERWGDGHIADQVLIRVWAEFGEDTWYLLRDADKRMLRDKYHQRIMSVFTPMPHARAQMLQELSTNGQLGLVKGLGGMEPDSKNGFRAYTNSGEMMEFDRVFSAVTPGARQAHREAQPLIDSLLASGSARLHPFGGLDVERNSSRVFDAQGQPQPRLSILGELAGGAYYFSYGHAIMSLRGPRLMGAIV